MIAVDTNIIIRYLKRDDPKQAAKAQKLIDAETIFVSTTVLLETEWVLRKLYKVKSAPLARSLRGFAGLPQVTLEEPGIVAQAIGCMEAGMDFADALHLAKADGCEAFMTFDRDLIRDGNKHGPVPVRAP